MVNIDPDKFRPLGKRVLVRRYSLPEQSAGGIYVLGRDYPTMGRVIKHDLEYWFGYEVQWEIKSDFESRIVGEDLLLLEEDDINLLFRKGRAIAVNDRILMIESSLPQTSLEISSILATKNYSKHGLGVARSVGWKMPYDIRLRDQILFDRSFASEIYLNNERHLIVRYEHCVAVVEDE